MEIQGLTNFIRTLNNASNNFDEEAIKELKKLECDNLELSHNYILKTDISELSGSERIKVVANIPYYITSPIIAHLLGEIDDKELIEAQAAKYEV